MKSTGYSSQEDQDSSVVEVGKGNLKLQFDTDEGSQFHYFNSRKLVRLYDASSVLQDRELLFIYGALFTSFFCLQI